jgi:hypothetical protein
MEVMKLLQLQAPGSYTTGIWFEKSNKAQTYPGNGGMQFQLSYGSRF